MHHNIKQKYVKNLSFHKIFSLVMSNKIMLNNCISHGQT